MSNNSTSVVVSSSTTPQSSIIISTTPTPTTESSTPDHTSSVVTSSIIASSAPASTQVFTSVITQSASGTSSLPPETVVVTSVSSSTDTSGSAPSQTSSSSSSTTTLSAGNKGSSNGGLSAGGKTAIAVVVPIVVVAILAVAGIFLWRRRKQRKDEKEQRKNEMEEYGYNPNHDPTLPAVAATDEIAEDTAGYRGWGTAVGSSTGRKTSTTMSGGHGAQLSDGGYHSPGSPTTGTVSDQNSGDPLMHGRNTMDSDTMGALGNAPAAAANRNGDIRRGPSNASSAYSAGDRSNHSAEAPIPVHNPPDYYADNAYYQPGPYDNPYGQNGNQPIIRDNPARRNTRIQEAPYAQGHQGGIAQNF